MTRPLIIFHSNCADGFSAAWCFWRKYGEDADYHAGIYGKPPPDVSGREVYIVDFSYRFEVIDAMSNTAHTIAILDHHKSAAEDLDRFPSFAIGPEPWQRRSLQGVFADCHTANIPQVAACFDMNRSGATLAWDFLFPEEPRPLLLGHVEDRDLWRFRLPNTREIQANVFSYEYTFEQWDRLMAAGQAELLQMTVAGAAIERKHHKDIAELLAVCTRSMTIGGHIVPVASLPYTMVSDAAGKLAVGQPFAATYWDTADHRIFGLRSADDGMDVSVIASAYGGGGHQHSAGFKVARDHVLATS